MTKSKQKHVQKQLQKLRAQNEKTNKDKPIDPVARAQQMLGEIKFETGAVDTQAELAVTGQNKKNKEDADSPKFKP